MKRLTLFLLAVLMPAIAFAQNPPGGYGPSSGGNVIVNGAGSTVNTTTIGGATTKVVYATNPIYAGGVKATGHLFIANLNTTGLMNTLTEMDGVTAYNPVASGLMAVGDYIACVDVFGKVSQTATLDMDDGTVTSFTATSIQSSKTTSTANATANCWTGHDDTAALTAAFNATLAIGSCGQLVLPAGKMIYSTQPFNNPTNNMCATKIKGQGSSINSGGTCCQATRDYGTSFTPTNGYVFNGAGNVCQTLLICDQSNSNGEVSNFVLDVLGIPFSSAVGSKNGLSVQKNYVHDVAVFGFWPTGAAVSTDPAFLANSSAVTVSNVACQGDILCAGVGGSNQVWNSPQFGNAGTNWLFQNAFNVTVNGGFEDEEVTAVGILTNSTSIRFSNVTMLGASGGANIAFTVDGTSTLWFDQCIMAVGAFSQTSLSIASGGKVTAQSTQFGTGNSTTNASIANTAGTFFDNGQNKCTTGNGTANNSGGTVPGSCQSNASTGLQISSLTHSVTNFTEGVVNLAASTIGTWTPDQNIGVTRIQATNTAGSVTCATPLVLSLSNGTTTQTLTLTSGQATWDTGVVAKPFVAGTAITLQQTAAGVCAVPPVNLNISILWSAGSGT